MTEDEIRQSVPPEAWAMLQNYIEQRVDALGSEIVAEKDAEIEALKQAHAAEIAALITIPAPPDELAALRDLFEQLPIEVQQVFAEEFVYVRVAVQAGRKDIARFFVERASVDPQYEPIREGIINALQS